MRVTEREALEKTLEAKYLGKTVQLVATNSFGILDRLAVVEKAGMPVIAYQVNGRLFHTDWTYFEEDVRIIKS